MAAQSLKVLLFAVGLALCVSVSHGQESSPLLKAKDVDGAVMGDSGQFEIAYEGVTFLIYDDIRTGQAYFVNADTKASVWSDPRFPNAPERKVVLNLGPADVKKRTRARTSKATLLAVALVPLLLIAAGMAGRIYYLTSYFPELLWPSKERKLRQRTNQKFKAQKARGKMSQDGKGGRSANS